MKSIVLACLTAALLTACAPVTASWLSVPIETTDGEPRPLAIVRVPLAELRARMPRFDPRQLAFYDRGREPIPHRIVDRDGDGQVDTAIVKLPIQKGGVLLTVVSPGPPAGDDLPPGGSDRGVVVRIEAAER